MKEDPPPDAKCRDKFLVQSVLVTADKEFTNVASLVGFHLQGIGAWLTLSVVVTHGADVQAVDSRKED